MKSLGNRPNPFIIKHGERDNFGYAQKALMAKAEPVYFTDEKVLAINDDHSDNDTNNVIPVISQARITIIDDDYTATVEDHTIIADGSSNTVDIELPEVTNIGKVFKIKAVDITNEVKVLPNGSDKIDGEDDYVFTQANESVTFVSDGTEWRLFGTGGVSGVAWDEITGNQSDVNVGGFTNDAGYITASSTDTLTNKSGNISMWTNDSGYITGNQTITLSGDVTGSGTTAITTTIANNAVTNAKLADMSGHTVKLNAGGSSADPQDFSLGSHSVLGRNGGDIISLDAGNNTVLRRGTGNTLAFGAVDISTAQVTGTLPIGNGGTGKTSFNANQVVFGTLQQTPSFTFTDNSTLSLGQAEVAEGIVQCIDPVDYTATALIGGFERHNYVLAGTAGNIGVGFGIGLNNPTARLHIVNGVSNFQNAITVNSNDAGSGLNKRGIDIFATSATQSYGVYAVAEGTGTGGAGTAGYFEGVEDGDGTGNAVGIFATAGGGLRNWAGFFNDGNVNIDNNLIIGGNQNSLPTRQLTFTDTGLGFERITTNTLGIYTNNTERVRIDNNGNVGIGTDDPTSKFHVEGNTRLNGIVVSEHSSASSITGMTINTTCTGSFNAVRGLYIESDNTGAIDKSSIALHAKAIGGDIENFAGFFEGDIKVTGNVGINIDPGVQPQYDIILQDSGLGIDRISTNTMGFYTAGNERIRIDNVGRVGINTDDPEEKLHVVGNIETSTDLGVVGSGTVHSSDFGTYFGVNEDLVPDPVPTNPAGYIVTFTSGSLEGQSFNLIGAVSGGWVYDASKDYFETQTTCQPDPGDAFDIYAEVKGNIKVGDKLILTDDSIRIEKTGTNTLGIYTSDTVRARIGHAGDVAINNTPLTSVKLRVTPTSSYGIYVNSGASIAAIRGDVSNANNPVIYLNQQNSTGAFIRFQGSVGSGTQHLNTAGSNATNPRGPNSSNWEHNGMIKINVNGTMYWIPYYNQI